MTEQMNIHGESQMQAGNQAQPPLLEVKALKKYFPIQRGFFRKVVGNVKAVDGVDFYVNEGETLGLVGESGCGKTTTGRCVLRALNPSSGEIWFQDPHLGRLNIAELEHDQLIQVRRNMRMIFQDPYASLNPRMTLLDIVGAPLRAMNLARGKELEDRVAEMLELVGLKDAARRKIGGFSGGMHQRMGIAQALLHRPPVLLLDEPTSALDPAGRYEVLDLLDKLRGAVTVFFSTHILADVERICDTIAIIHKGQLLLVAGRDELRERYPLNTAVLELDAASLPWTEAFIALLKTQPWITGVTQEESVLRIVVNDVAHGKQALLPLVLQQGVILTRYEWVRPTLEEIFLKVSA